MLKPFFYRPLTQATVVGLALLSLTALPSLAQTQTEMPSPHTSGSAHDGMPPEQMQQHHQSMLKQMRQMTAHMEEMTPEMMAQMTPEQQQQHQQQMMAQMKTMMAQMEQWGQAMQGNHPMPGNAPHQMEGHQNHPSTSDNHDPASHQ